MANRRWRSEPGHREGHLNENVDGLVNPFWSQGVQHAAMVDGSRPTTLPQVPGTPGSLPPVLMNGTMGGDETPQPVQGLRGAIGSGGGIVRSQGPMPSSQMAFQTPSSWNPQTPGQGGSQAFRLNEEVHNFNLFDMDEDLSRQAACAGIPQGDLLGPLGGEVHREKGFGGNLLGPLGDEVHRERGFGGDLLGPLGGEGHRRKGQGGDDQRGRHGDEMHSQPQGPLRQDLGRAGSADQVQRHRSC